MQVGGLDPILAAARDKVLGSVAVHTDQANFGAGCIMQWHVYRLYRTPANISEYSE